MISAPRFTTIGTNGIGLHVAQAGPADGPPVVLLHGFPEFWYGWRHQIGPLAEAGFRVLAPDQRGYHRSDRPGRVADYALDTLAADVAGLIAATGRPAAALVGHDWGGGVACWTALRYPERVTRLVLMNAPHPIAFRRYFRTHPRQWLRSWFVYAFQLPDLPERMLGRAGGRPLAESLRATSWPGTFTDEDLARYREAWSEPSTLRSMIHWYRAIARHTPKPPADPWLALPTLLVIWGGRDRFLGPGVADATVALCDRGRLERIPEATHWVQHEEPVRVNRLLIDFLGAEPGA